MFSVLLATLPGVAALALFFGPGVLVNISVCVVLAVAFESLALLLRRRRPLQGLGDGSALVTAVLLGIALPPYAPWWLLLVGIASAILIAKHLYGGLGYNPFNPAMVGYVVLLISFPLQMSSWAPPLDLRESAPGLVDALRACFLPGQFDAVTMATPLDVLRQNSSTGYAALRADYPQLGPVAGVGWLWVNLGFLAGGLWLLQQRIFSWHAPLSMLAALALLASVSELAGLGGGPARLHLLSGATMFGAFFIITDPVTSAVSQRGRLVFGALIGVLVYLIRSRGNYPDAVAFAVLIMNFAAPFIDDYTQPRAYGHGRTG
jgi:electron transport complex protein RnfD